MKTIRLLTLPVLASALVTSAFADLDLANLDALEPGCALGVVDGSELVLQSYKGLANIRYDVPISATTSFDIGSISKHFTVAVFFQLEKKGLFSREDLLSKYYPNGPSWFKSITLGQLITHQSGIPDYLNDEDFALSLLSIVGIEPSVVINLIAGKPLTHEFVVNTVLEGLASLPEPYSLPENSSRYSNTGYLLLANILEMTAEKSFPQLAEEIIFVPHGMTQTFVGRHSPEKSKGAATGYELTANGYQELHDNLAAYGDGFVYTTVQDFAKWMSVLLGSTDASSPWSGFLQDPEQMRLPTFYNAYYGNGLAISDYSGWFYDHSGFSIDGMNSYFWVSPAQGIGYVQMCNSEASIQARNYEVIRWVFDHREDSK